MWRNVSAGVRFWDNADQNLTWVGMPPQVAFPCHVTMLVKYFSAHFSGFDKPITIPIGWLSESVPALDRALERTGADAGQMPQTSCRLANSESE
jgi:hypothetical protein